MNLKELFRKYPTDKDTDHSYGEVYEEILSPLRESADRIVELGIDKGGSLLAWESYFSRAEVIGIDLNDCSHIDRSRIRTFQLDVRIHYQLHRCLRRELSFESCDVIIDDGPHNLIQQIGCLYVLWEFLKPDGLYIVEDAIQMWEYLNEPYHLPLEGITETEVIDRRHVKGRDDDILIVFKKDGY